MLVGFLSGEPDPDDIPWLETGPDGFISLRPFSVCGSQEVLGLIDMRLVADGLDETITFTVAQARDMLMALSAAVEEAEEGARDFEAKLTSPEAQEAARNAGL